MPLRSQTVSLTGQTTTTGQAARRLRRTFPRFSLLLLVFTLILSAPSTGWAAETAASTTKRTASTEGNAASLIAAYLLNFVKYVDWPEAIPPPGEPWRIGVLNNERVRDAFNPMMKGMRVRGRPIEVVHSNDPTDLSACQIVLLPSSGAGAAAKIFVERPILTVFYHEKESTEVAAAIELLLQKQNMRYRLNPGLLRAQGLKPREGLAENSLPQTTPKPARSL